MLLIDQARRGDAYVVRVLLPFTFDNPALEIVTATVEEARAYETALRRILDHATADIHSQLVNAAQRAASTLKAKRAWTDSFMDFKNQKI